LIALVARDTVTDNNGTTKLVPKAFAAVSDCIKDTQRRSFRIQKHQQHTMKKGIAWETFPSERKYFTPAAFR
jgi:hypothetical protein